jgi:predicted DNA binding CopG/RHH family protein
MRKIKLSEEEQEILDIFDSKSVAVKTSKNFLVEKKIATDAAEAFAKKSERINIRLTPYDLEHIKRIAAKEGVPYQTLISSILHKYAAGYLKTG